MNSADPVVTVENGYFDISEPSDFDKKFPTSVTTFINMLLFTRPWWANPDSGSDFEDQTDGINTNETRRNIEISLETVKAILLQENLATDFQYRIELNAQDVFLYLQWKTIESDVCEKMEISA